jgi:succinate-semialdehyde dehydrogenase/glutarate-semialdehyde dehydrogenase
MMSQRRDHRTSPGSLKLRKSKFGIENMTDIPRLKNKELLRDCRPVAGQWVEADQRGTITVINPSTGGLVARVPNMAENETRRAIAFAETVAASWRAKTAKERAVVMRRWFDLMMQNQEDLAAIMTAEQGKPLAESRGEIAYAASFVEWFAEEGKRIYGDTIPAFAGDKRIIVLKQPIGVCAAITPWNFPAAMIARKAAPALAAGCTMVVKPASQTPLSALALVYLAEQAGVPPGVLSCVTGSASAIGGEMTSNPIVRKRSPGRPRSEKS